MSDHANARSVMRKMAITAIVGAGSFPITDMIFSSLPEQFAMAVGFGSVVLFIQFLVDFEKRLHKVEVAQKYSITEMQRVVAEGFAGVNDTTRLFAQVEAAGLRPAVTELMRHASRIGTAEPPLARAFARSEVERWAEFLRDFADHEAAYDGEDRDWLIGLTRQTKVSIDAISIPEVDAAGNAFHSFWESDLGRRYMELQREAVQRGVTVRRVFVTERDEMAGDPSLQRICRIQVEYGIDVRLMYRSAIQRDIRNSLFDFILFDNIMSYESTPAPHVEEGEGPMILDTRLILRKAKVEERIQRYRNIWASSIPWVSADSPEGDPVTLRMS